jgi:hypothetical protein
MTPQRSSLHERDDSKSDTNQRHGNTCPSREEHPAPKAIIRSSELLADAAVLVRELQDFRMSFSTAGNAIFGAREGAHDDLVLAVALAIFGATQPAMAMDIPLQWAQ